MFKASYEKISTRCLLQYTALLLLALSVLMVGSKVTVHAATIMVSPGGLTIQEAINMANPNDTILVSAGNYPERLVISKPLHLLGASKENTVIDGQGMGTVVWVNSSNVEIRGFTVKDPDQYGWGIHVERSDHVNITSNAISAGVDGDGTNLVGVLSGKGAADEVTEGDAQAFSDTTTEQLCASKRMILHRAGW